MWVYAYDLAESVRPEGELSNNMCDLAISVLQDSCPPNKVIFLHLVTKYLLEGNFNATLVKRAFRRDQKYILSHKDLVCGCLVVYSSFLWACDNFSSHMWVTVVIWVTSLFSVVVYAYIMYFTFFMDSYVHIVLPFKISNFCCCLCHSAFSVVFVALFPCPSDAWNKTTSHWPLVHGFCKLAC